jgi:hypothetical protein
MHPNRIWNWVLPFDSNSKIHAHPNNLNWKRSSFLFHHGFGILTPIQFRAHFFSIMDLVISRRLKILLAKHSASTG